MNAHTRDRKLCTFSISILPLHLSACAHHGHVSSNSDSNQENPLLSLVKSSECLVEWIFVNVCKLGARTLIFSERSVQWKDNVSFLFRPFWTPTPTDTVTQGLPKASFGFLHKMSSVHACLGPLLYFWTLPLFCPLPILAQKKEFTLVTFAMEDMEIRGLMKRLLVGSTVQRESKSGIQMKEMSCKCYGCRRWS